MPGPLVITQGDPAGVGPELALKLLADPPCSSLKIIGCRQHLAGIAESLELPFPGDHIIDLPLPGPIEMGKVSPVAGAHSFDCLEAAVEGALVGTFRGVVTNPIHKEAWHLAGKPFPAHTEYLAEKTKTPSHAMMLTSKEITCSLVTTHVPLHRVPQLITRERILEVIELTYEAISAIHGRPARLAMPGLNPHAGEAGLFGREEIDLIIPVLEEARAQGIEILGPLSPDTAFLPAIRREVDAYVCLYHDQGLIPLKTLAFDLGVNVTLGLPIVRTSVDHGTAFNIAGQGTASVNSLIEATLLAHRMASTK
jgi:4-hydroxythreonine-4-phosphate dehydrogenase